MNCNDCVYAYDSESGFELYDDGESEYMYLKCEAEMCKENYVLTDIESIKDDPIEYETL